MQARASSTFSYSYADLAPAVGAASAMLKLATSTCRTPSVTERPACLTAPLKTTPTPAAGSTVSVGASALLLSSSQKAVPPPSNAPESSKTFSVSACLSLCGSKNPPAESVQPLL